MCWSSPFQNIIPGVGVGVVVGESCSSQGTELCKACFLPGMCRQGEARDGKEPFQPYIPRRAWILSSKCWKIKEEIPEQKWQVFAEHCSSSSVTSKKEKAVSLQCLKTVAHHFWQSQRALQNWGLLLNADLVRLCPAFVQTPLLLKLSSSNTILEKWAKWNDPHSQMENHL